MSKNKKIEWNIPCGRVESPGERRNVGGGGSWNERIEDESRKYKGKVETQIWNERRRESRTEKSTRIY